MRSRYTVFTLGGIDYLGLADFCLSQKIKIRLFTKNLFKIFPCDSYLKYH